MLHKPNFAAVKHLLVYLCALTPLVGCDPGPKHDAIALSPEIVRSKWENIALGSLSELSIDSLRSRPYGSSLKVVKQLGSQTDDSDYSLEFSADGSKPYDTFVASYESDQLSVTSRIDVPAGPAPKQGFPVVIFVHGWYGREAAPAYDFMYKPDSQYARAIDTYVDAGFMVFSPSLRGHGTIDGVAADGIEFLEAWDNGSYLSPIFYAIDILNLADSLEDIDWAQWQNLSATPDLSRIHVTGQSQGADAVLTALAVSGEDSLVSNPFRSGSIWSGCFGTRFAQAEIYGPMENTLEAFMSGDGSWTGTATGKDGSVNPNFVFGWPPDWIGTTDTDSPAWIWQKDTWSVPTVAESLNMKFSEMYEAINRQVRDISDARFEIVFNESGKAIVRHDPRIEAAMKDIGGFEQEKFLTEPLLLHHSDRDYLSIPAWNRDLASRINAAGGYSRDYTYPGNTHGLGVSSFEWFSPPGTLAGFELMLARDIALMNTESPSD